MNFSHLRTFVAIAETGGVHRAAARLHLSQPAVSRQISALETELDVPLFERLGRRVRLTSEGEDLLQRARDLLAGADSLGERARSLKAGDTGILRVGATPHAIESLLSKFLIRYRRAYPDVQVHLVEDGGIRLHGRLERGDVQVAISAVGGTRLEERLLYPMHLVAGLAPAHRLSRRPVLDIAELAEEPLLVLHHGFGSRAWFDTACQLAHMRPRVVLESSAAHTVLALAATGYGIAILPSNVQVPPGIVRAVPLVHRGASLGTWSHILWDSQRFLPRYAEGFIEELVAYCRSDYPGRDVVRRAPRLPKPAASGR